jgi:sulfatase modifying factor 1
MGKIINNNYELLQQLGQGGMGVVYKARHIHFNEIVAIKRLWEQYDFNEIVKNLFFNEGKILRRLHHNNIVMVTDLFEFEGNHYIVMEYIEGRTLNEIIKREIGPIQQERAIELFKQMLRGMAYVHNQTPLIIHRDINPLNILVTPDDTIKITDFGIAKALEAGGNASTVVKRTPVYMSPEQIFNPKAVDVRTDIYNLGITFYEMLCAGTPFTDDTTTTPTAVYSAIPDGEIPRPTDFYSGISDALSDFVMKAIHKDRNHRFVNTNEMLGELEKLEKNGEILFQETSKFVPLFVKNPVPKEPKDSSRVSTKIEEPLSSTEKSEAQLTVPKEIEINKSNIWKWVAGLVIVAGIISELSFAEEEKVSLLLLDKVKAESPGPNLNRITSLTLIQQKEMVFVEGGSFMMGSNLGKADEKPEHLVSLESFFIGKYEVTQELWESVIGNNPSEFKRSNHPVEQVSWFESVDFCNKLSEKEGLQKAYIINVSGVTCNFNSNGYRLPTEAEWEYAARGGNKSRGYKYSGSNDVDLVAWYSKNSRSMTNAIGGKQKNELGIYDMSGNVWELCWDWYSDTYYTTQSQTNPKGPAIGYFRVFRGGGGGYFPEGCRVSFRFSGFTPDFGNETLGFRVVRTKK